MMASITNFLLTQLIWSITGGLSHIPISFILLFILLKLWDHLSWVRAFSLSLTLTASAFGLFFIPLVVILVWVLQVPYILPEDTYQGSFDYLNTSLMLACIYSVLQITLLLFLRKWFRFNFWRTALCVICAHLMSALLVYKMTFN
jgi:hypothetical protein